MCPVSMTYSAIPALRHDAGDRRRVGAAADRGPTTRRGALCGMAMTEKQGGSDVRANTTQALDVGDGLVRAHRPQVVLLAPDVRRLPGARPGAGAALSCFVVERGPGLRDPAPQGQARHALAGVLGGRVPGRPRAAARRGGPRRRDDHRHGHPHAAGLRDRDRGRRCAARVAEAAHHARHRSRVRRAADRPAADGQRARRPRARVRGRDRDRRCGSRAPTTRATTQHAPLRHRGPEVLGQQARDPACRRGARVPRRQRLRRGGPDGDHPARRRRSTGSGRARAT